MKSIVFKEKKIFYDLSGKGKTVVLLHGFTETHKVWDFFIKKLSENYQVLAIDLPGHGKSETVAEVHTMELMADVVQKVLKHCSVRKCIMFGHSMGGFITLAFAEKYPNMLRGIGLLNSHAFEDSPEGKNNRDRTIDLVKADKFSYMSQFIPQLIAEKNREKLKKKIDKLVRKANEMNPEGIIAAQAGMKLRPSRLQVLADAKVPVLFVIGLQDTRMPVDRAWEMIRQPKVSSTLVLRDVAHIASLEAPKETLRAVRTFLKSI
ncbi:MAG: alpha/beta hydrolase [Bacteroidota bacterium]|nr:alpha/beta hydrolase [Bacteroidota bacterium]